VKIWVLVSEKFFEIEIILFWAPFTGGPDAKILFLSVRRPPTAQKNSSLPRTSRFGDMGVKVSTFPPLPPKLGGKIPSICCIGYTRDDLQKPWKFCESLVNSFRDIRLFTVRAYRRDTIVSSTLKAESLYSDEHSFTSHTDFICAVYIPTVVHGAFSTCMPVLHWCWLLMCCGLVLSRSVFSSVAADVDILAVIYCELLEVCALFRIHGSCWQAAGVLVWKQWRETAAVWKRWISCEARHWHCMNMLLTYTLFQRKFTFLCLCHG